MASDIGTNSPLREYEDRNGNRSCLLLVCSKELSQSLLEKGWDDFKKGNNTRILDFVPEDLQNHIVRGLWDGDGSISKKANGQFSANFVDMHKPPVEWVANFILERTEHEIPVRKRNDQSLFYIHFDGNRKVCEILSEVYTSQPVLSRKQVLVDNLKSVPKSLRLNVKVSINEKLVFEAFKSFGPERIKALYEAGCSQIVIANKLGVSVSYISRTMRKHHMTLRIYSQ